MIENKIRLNFLAGVQIGNEIYFSAWNMNGLFKYNTQTKNCNFIKVFPGEEEVGIHSEAIYYKNTIWFIPRASEHIAIVDLTSFDITFLELPSYAHRTEKHVPPIRMKACFQSGEKFLWLIPYTYKLFLKIDMDRKEIINEENWENDGHIVSVGVRIKDKIWIYKNKNHEICTLNIISGEQEIRKIGNENTFYMGIQNIDEWIVIFPRFLKDGMILININTNETKIMKIEDDGQWYYEYQAIIKNNIILLVPYIGKKCLQICLEKGHCDIKKSYNLNIKENAYCSTKITFDKQIWFLSHVLDNPIICYNPKDDNFLYYYLEIEREIFNNDILNCLEKYGIEFSPLEGLKFFYEQNISLITFLKGFSNKSSKHYGLIYKKNGEMIYEKISY